MTESNLPQRLTLFICENIHSIEQLEIVLLLHGAAGEPWTADRIASTLRIEEKLAQSALRDLATRGFVSNEPRPTSRWRYVTKDPENAQLIDTLADLYPKARVEVVMLISRSAMDRIRTSQVRAFARAFLLKRTKDDT